MNPLQTCKVTGISINYPNISLSRLLFICLVVFILSGSCVVSGTDLFCANLLIIPGSLCALLVLVGSYVSLSLTFLLWKYVFILLWLLIYFLRFTGCFLILLLGHCNVAFWPLMVSCTSFFDVPAVVDVSFLCCCSLFTLFVCCCYCCSVSFPEFVFISFSSFFFFFQLLFHYQRVL